MLSAGDILPLPRTNVETITTCFRKRVCVGTRVRSSEPLLSDQPNDEESQASILLTPTKQLVP